MKYTLKVSLPCTYFFSSSFTNTDCKFQDEIDIYKIDDYVRGTKALFDPERSHVDLVGEVVASDTEVNFKFSEVLTFNVPFKPHVSLTGRVTLSRGNDGLISSSREYWDSSVPKVLSTVSFKPL